MKPSVRIVRTGGGNTNSAGPPRKGKELTIIQFFQLPWQKNEVQKVKGKIGYEFCCILDEIDLLRVRTAQS